MSRITKLREAHPSLTEHGARVLLIKRGHTAMQRNGENSVWGELQQDLDDYTQRLCQMSTDELLNKVIRTTEFMDTSLKEMLNA